MNSLPPANLLNACKEKELGGSSAVYTHLGVQVTHLGFQGGSGWSMSVDSSVSLSAVFLYPFEFFIFVFLAVPNPLYLFWQVEQRK